MQQQGGQQYGRRSRISGLFNRLETHFALHPGDPDQAMRISVLLLYGLVGCGLAFSWAFEHWRGGGWQLALAFLACGLAAILIMLRLARTRAYVQAAHLTLALWLATTVLGTLLTGGLRLTNVAPFFIVMVAAIFLLGYRGLPWLLAAVVTALAFQHAHWLGVTFVDLVPPERQAVDAFFTWISSAVSVAVFLLAYERARVQAQRQLRDANAAKTQLLAAVSHELRTPLHAMLGVQDELARAPLQDELRQRLRVARRNGRALASLIDDLLDVAAGERGQLTLDQAPFDLRAVLEQVAEVARLECEAKRLRFVLQVDERLPGWVHGDGRRLRQMLLNLIANALRATSQGQIALRACRSDAPIPEVLLAVEDSGHGIPPHLQPQVFEAFTSVARSRGTSGGTGLGLHLTRELAQRMGGRIELRSTPSAGSTFTLLLPLPPVEVGAQLAFDGGTSPPQGLPVLSGRRVLLVEDNEDNRLVAEDMLRELRVEVQTACDGQEFLERWRAVAPDVVLMDVQMPRLDGVEATRRLRELERCDGCRPVPVIGLTGHATGHDKRRCLEAGMSDCLFKPFTLEQLYQALVRQLPAAG